MYHYDAPKLELSPETRWALKQAQKELISFIEPPIATARHKNLSPRVTLPALRIVTHSIHFASIMLCIIAITALLSELSRMTFSGQTPSKFQLSFAYAEEVPTSSNTLILRHTSPIRADASFLTLTVSSYPALHRAAYYCDIESVLKLLDAGAELNAMDQNGESPLSWAAKSNCHAVASLLIARGANVNHTSDNGYTPYKWAMINRNLNTLSLLGHAGGHV